MSNLMSLRDIAAKLGKSESRMRVIKTWDGFPAPVKEWYAVGRGRMPALYRFEEVQEFYLANTGKRVGKPKTKKSYDKYF